MEGSISRTQARIAQVRVGYKPCATRVSRLYFVVADLALVDPMYQYSLQWFLGLFEAGLDNSDKHEDVEVLPCSHGYM